MLQVVTMSKKLLLCCIVILTTSYCLAASANSGKKGLDKRVEFTSNCLSEEQLAHYLREGYVIVKKLFSDEEIDSIDNAANALKYRALKLAKKHDVQAEKKLIDTGTQFVISKKQKIM